MKFNFKLKRLRLENEYTQTELGNMLNLGRTAISRYESGELEPSLNTLIQLSKIFRITLDELIGDDK